MFTVEYSQEVNGYFAFRDSGDPVLAKHWSLPLSIAHALEWVKPEVKISKAQADRIRERFDKDWDAVAAFNNKTPNYILAHVLHSMTETD